jgi:transcriptional regulator with XRE-family HTH domain
MFGNLGTTLALLRQLRGRSQATLAREAGIGKSQLSKYENGKELPRLDSLEKVLSALQVGYFEFFYTLHVIDEKAGSLGSDPEPVITSGPSVLRPSTQTAFQELLGMFFNLYGMVIQQAIAGGQRREEVAGPDRGSPNAGKDSHREEKP